MACKGWEYKTTKGEIGPSSMQGTTVEGHESFPHVVLCLQTIMKIFILFSFMTFSQRHFSDS